jgi:hypothetical protein
VLLPLAVVACGGCSLTANVMARAEKSPAGEFGHQLVEQLQSRNFDALLASAERKPENDRAFREMAAFFPVGESGVTHLERYASNQVVGAATYYELVFETIFPGRAVLTQVKMRGDGARFWLEHLQVLALTAPLEKIHAFSFSGRGPRHYLFFLGMFVVPAIVIAALVLWARRRRELRHKWLWLAAVVLAVGDLTINWTSGAFRGSPVQLRALGVAFGRDGLHGPWFLSLSLPIGAVAFLWLKGRGRAPSARADLVAHGGAEGDGAAVEGVGPVAPGVQGVDHGGVDARVAAAEQVDRGEAAVGADAELDQGPGVHAGPDHRRR